MQSNILCLGAGSSMTEALKNLILPGCGHFTIVDPRMVTERDLGNNFFVTVQDIGKPLAEATLKNLLELNEDVKGESVVCDISKFVEENSLKDYSIVIVSNLPIQFVVPIDNACRELNIPLIYCHSYGMIGHIRLSYKEHNIVEGKFQNNIDLRLYNPFNSLNDYCSKFDLDKLSKEEIYKIPFPVLLLHTMKKWKNLHDGKEPSNSDEKAKFRELYNIYYLTYRIKEIPHEEGDGNFAEAAEFSYYCYTPTELPNDMNELMNNHKMNELSNKTDKFWFVVRAINDFYKNHKYLPLSGRIPDITCSTENYIDLQEVYNNEYIMEGEEIKEICKKYLHENGLNEDYIENEYYSYVLKNINCLTSITTSSISDEIELKSSKEAFNNEFYEGIKECNNIPLYWYLLLRSNDTYYSKYGKYININDNEKEKSDFSDICSEICEKYNNAVHINDKDIKEMLRYSDNVELITINSIIGGIVSEEAIKLLCKEFIPLNNTFIMCGMNGSALNSYSGVYKL